MNSSYSFDATSNVLLTAKYRYCIEVFHKGLRNTKHWVGLGITLPNAQTQFPISQSKTFVLLGIVQIIYIIVYNF